MDIIKKEEVLGEGYVITNKCLPKVFRDRDADEEYQNPGIKMIVEECSDMDSLIKVFKECHCDDVPDNWYDILFGKLPGWKLCTVTVNDLHIIFDFVNPELHNQKADLRKAGKKDELISMPESSGFAMLAIDDFPHRFWIRLRFETILPTGGISSTIVNIEDGKHSVIRFLPSEYRSYEFIGKGDFQDDDGVKVILTEYLW